jgi:hypothetical protein
LPRADDTLKVATRTTEAILDFGSDRHGGCVCLDIVPVTNQKTINADHLVLVKIAPAHAGPFAQAGCCNHSIREYKEAREWGSHPGNTTRGANNGGEKKGRRAENKKGVA